MMSLRMVRGACALGSRFSLIDRRESIKREQSSS
jgi:hypothetical protein